MRRWRPGAAARHGAADGASGWSPLSGLPKRISRKALWVRGLSLGLFVGLLVLAFDSQGTFNSAEAATFQIRLRLRVTSFFAPPTNKIAIVAIDDPSCSIDWGHGGCPPQRADTATLINKLTAAGSRAVVLDQLLEGDRAGTDQLSAALKRAGNVVIAQRLEVSEQFGAEEISLMPLNQTIAGAARAIGLASIHCGAGVRLVETYSLGCVWEANWYPSLAVAAYRLLTGKPKAYEGAGSIRLSYAGLPLETYPTYSYRRIVDALQCLVHGLHVRCPGQVGPDLWDNLRGMVVFLGRTDLAAPDTFDDPFGLRKTMPGVEVQATALNTLLNNDPLHEVSNGGRAALIVGAALGLAAIATASGLVLGLSLAVLMLLCYNVLAGLALVRLNLIVPVVAPDTAMAVSFLLVVGARYALEERGSRRTRQLFCRFVSPAVVDDLMLDARGIAAGERRPIAIVFTDIRGFTTLSEYTEPDVVMGALRTYFSRMVSIVLAHGGTVDKYIGDGMMALFGAPQHIPEPCVAALRAALAMQDAMVELNELLSGPLGTELRIGIGINYGDAVFGLSGAPSKLEFTAIGDAVNTASRLESLCRDKGCTIVLSESVYERLPQSQRHGMLDLGLVNVKGRQGSIHVYGLGQMNVGAA